MKNSGDFGIRFDLLANVYLNGALIGSGQLNSVSGGSSGFVNAQFLTIPLVLSAPVEISPTDTLWIEIAVRNACSGSGKSFGTAALWYNGQPIDTGANEDAGSRFEATIAGSSREYFLRERSALSTTAGSSRLSTDAAAGSMCGPFDSVQIWSTSPQKIRPKPKNVTRVRFH